MPRQARTISATNVYHAILRGVNKQQVFEDDEDYIRFFNVLRGQTTESDLSAPMSFYLLSDGQFQALPRPQQKLHLFAAHEEGIGLRTLSRLTGVPYSIVQRATSDTVRYGSMVCESLPGDDEYETYIDDTEYEKYPEY